VPDLRPRKLPRQARARETVDALLEACARLLRRGGLAAVTTNAIADRAGVSIGSLYEFFPNREAILAELTRRRLERLAAAVEAELDASLALDDPVAATDRLLRALVTAVSADRELYRALLREAPFLRTLPETRRALAALFALGRVGSERARGRVSLPHLEADAWLIGRMVAHAVLEIAWLDEGAPSRELLTRELVRLTFRMIHGRDPDDRGRAPALRRRAARARAAR
jgi:AcrR family transcriptional regulator